MGSLRGVVYWVRLARGRGRGRREVIVRRGDTDDIDIGREVARDISIDRGVGTDIGIGNAVERDIDIVLDTRIAVLYERESEAQT
jgi:hypothetical protein